MLSGNLLAVFGLCATALAIPSQIPFSSIELIKEIDTWALNPNGDAAVIRVKSGSQHELHLLAINAQFTVPSVSYDAANAQARYTFLNDQTILTVSPTSEGQEGVWDLTTQILNSTTIPPAYPPSASKPNKLGGVILRSDLKELVHSAQASVLTVVLPEDLVLIQVAQHEEGWAIKGEPQLVKHKNLKIEGVTSNGTHLAYSASNHTASFIYLFDLHDTSSSPVLLRHSTKSQLIAPTFGNDEHIAWLSDRQLWLSTGNDEWEVPLDFDLFPEKIIFSKDGKAIYLLAPHDDQQSLFHLWTPSKSATKPIAPVRIPSNGTIHSAIHVGTTPLDHAHLIGIKSDSAKGEGKELWVISHSPHEDPTYNYENIRLTYFT
ncbi:hypothetical protein L486_02846 [Kwoniella mangroviensis CBS 10435]|uniref:Uncharacterized protein n=1 Tax=Kwoniella mangroviensis CBS 10435 TaxID=1331196 RepID=A0A1B9IXA9_9TREE|nr:hypothetical protein L486_02846 [Kwoniella mangroviensis CBS 10435]